MKLRKVQNIKSKFAQIRLMEKPLTFVNSFFFFAIRVNV